MPRQKKYAAPDRLARELRKAIRQSGLTHYEIGKRMKKFGGSGRSDPVTRFADGRDSQLSTIEAIAEVLGYRIVLEEVENELSSQL